MSTPIITAVANTEQIIKNMQNKQVMAPTAGLLGRRRSKVDARAGENTQHNIASYVKQIREVRGTHA